MMWYEGDKRLNGQYEKRAFTLAVKALNNPIIQQLCRGVNPNLRTCAAFHCNDQIFAGKVVSFLH